MSDLPDHDLVLVVDFGAQYAQLIARRVREAKVYSEIVPHTMPVEQMLARRPKAIVLSGGPQSVYVPGAPQLDPGLLRSGTPVFGICYGFMAMAAGLDGDVAHTGQREYGRTSVSVTEPGTLLQGLPTRLDAWMSHGDEVVRAPAGFTVNATSPRATVAAFEDAERGLAGVQWHPEVLHTQYGQEVLERFLVDIAGCRRTWTMVNIVEEQIEHIRAQIGGKRAICGLSGGVDSAVAAALVQRAIGDRLTCVFVDHGLLRQGEAEQVERDYVAATGVALKVVEVADRFLSAWTVCVTRRPSARSSGASSSGSSRRPRSRWPRSTAVRSDSWSRARCTRTSSSPEVARVRPASRATTTSAAYPRTCSSPSSSRCARCSRTRYAWSVSSSDYRPTSCGGTRSPVPDWPSASSGPWTPSASPSLRAADAIAREELTAAGLDRDIWQFPVVLLADVRSVGVQGDGRTYGHPIVLRPVTSEDAMTADWGRLPYEVLEMISTRITNEVEQVNRVVVDITSKPPGTIEWE